MHGQTQRDQKIFDGPLPVPQLLFRVAEEQKIIDIAQVRMAPQITFDELVEFIEIAVGPELAGEIADGQTAWPSRSEQIVAWEIDYAIFIFRNYLGCRAVAKSVSCSLCSIP
jgi:hypothetical protein